MCCINVSVGNEFISVQSISNIIVSQRSRISGLGGRKIKTYIKKHIWAMTVIESKNKDAYATTTNLNYFIAFENALNI